MFNIGSLSFIKRYSILCGIFAHDVINDLRIMPSIFHVICGIIKFIRYHYHVRTITDLLQCCPDRAEIKRSIRSLSDINNEYLIDTRLHHSRFKDTKLRFICFCSCGQITVYITLALTPQHEATSDVFPLSLKICNASCQHICRKRKIIAHILRYTSSADSFFYFYNRNP